MEDGGVGCAAVYIALAKQERRLRVRVAVARFAPHLRNEARKKVQEL